MINNFIHSDLSSADIALPLEPIDVDHFLPNHAME